MTLCSHSGYVGRFAPSPSGPLLFGSLIAALGSFLQARSQGGAWLVRIEDLDPPREVPGAADDILRTLERLGLTWDGQVLYQSQRHERYQAILDRFHEQGLTYYCRCSRAQIQAAGGLYPGTCRTLGLPAIGNAMRVQMSQPIYDFIDELHGRIQIPSALAAEDFILKRRDGLFAYNLAVVVDDADSRVTQVVRGADLIEPTVRQIALYRLLGQPEPSWLHLPLAVQKTGFKLSIQNHAPALLPGAESRQIWQALQFLGQEPPAELQGDRDLLLQWAIGHWQQHKIPQMLEILWQ